VTIILKLLLILLGIPLLYIAGTFVFMLVFFWRKTPNDDNVDGILRRFPDLTYEKVQFASNKGQMLKGWIYRKGDGSKKGIVVFSHGLGGTHIENINQIDFFAERGFVVFGFDNTGSGESDGNSMVDLPQATIDLDFALRFIEGREEFVNLPVLLFGHSWGGFAVCTMLSTPHKIAGVVSCSGFDSPSELKQASVGNFFGIFTRAIVSTANLFSRIRFGSKANRTAMESLAVATAPVLIIHSKDDDVVAFQCSILDACRRLEYPGCLSPPGQTECHSETARTQGALRLLVGQCRPLPKAGGCPVEEVVLQRPASLRKSDGAARDRRGLEQAAGTGQGRDATDRRVSRSSSSNDPRTGTRKEKLTRER
jgi:alpha-beta hydrolase superfamily lysophospholipase